MKLSLHRDLLLVIISSMAVLTISWLQLVKGNVLTFIEYVAILLLPGYSLMTAIWPSEDRIEWSLRAGVGFVLGLFFVLFLPIILESQNMGSLNENLTILLLILAILLCLVAMIRRREPSDEEYPYGGKQLTLEESIQRASELRDREVEEHAYDEYEYDMETGHFEYHDEESDLEETSEDERETYPVREEESEETEEPDEYQQLREEKPLQYQRMRDRGYFDEESSEDTIPESAQLQVDEDVKTEPYPTDYEEEMDRPVWMDEKAGQKTGRNWYNLLRNIILAFLILGIILAVMDLLGWNTGLVKDISKYSMEIIIATSLTLVLMVLISKWRTSRVSEEDIPDEVIPSEDEAYLEEIEEKELLEPVEEPPKRPEPKKESKIEKILSIILIISIILAISTTVYIIVKPKQGEKFTEFYILGPDGKASDYPTNLTNGDVGRVIIGVVNHEYATTNYKLLVKVGNRTLKNDTFTLKNGEKKEIPFNFTAGNNGQKKMQFLLYKLPDQEKAYRSLHLWLNITS